MRGTVAYLLVPFAGAVILAGCERVGEPCNNNGYLNNQRTRTTEVQKQPAGPGHAFSERLRVHHAPDRVSVI